MNDQPTINLDLIKRLAVPVAIFIMALIVLSIFLSNTWVTVSAASQGTEDITVTLGGAKTQTFKLTPGATRKLFVHTGDYTVTAEQSHRYTLTTATVAGFRSNTIHLTLQDEANATKVGDQSMSCGFTVASIYYSYDCNQSSLLFKHTPLTAAAFSDKQPFLSDEALPFVQPLGNGLITFGGESGPMFFDLTNSQRTLIKYPDAFQDADSSDLFTIVNDQPGSAYQFAFVNRNTHVWALYRNPADQNPTMVTLKAPDKANVNLTNQLSGDKFLAYFTGTAPQTTEDTTQTAPDSHALVYSTSGQAQADLTIPASTKATTAELVGPDTIITQLGNGGLKLFTFSGNTATAGATIPDATNLTVGAGHILFTRANDIYELHLADLQSHRLFSSEGHLQTVSLRIVGNTILLNTTTKDDPDATATNTSAFVIDTATAPIYPRPEANLPYIGNDNINRMDYNAKILRIGLNLPSLGWDRSTGKPFYDQTEYDAAVKSITDELTSDGLNKRFQIIFGF